MTFPKHRSVRRIAVVALLPLLLAGALWWRAEHPPLTDADIMLRAAAKTSREVKVSGWGARWCALTGLKAGQSFTIQDRALASRLFMALRCSGGEIPADPWRSDFSLTLVAPNDESPAPDPLWWFAYYGDATHHILSLPLPVPNNSGIPQSGFSVRPRFASRFEALVVDLARRAKTGEPGLTLNAP